MDENFVVGDAAFTAANGHVTVLKITDGGVDYLVAREYNPLTGTVLTTDLVPRMLFSSSQGLSITGRPSSDDTLRVDISGLGSKAISYEGGSGGHDTLSIIDSSSTTYATVTHSFINQNNGSVAVSGGPTISYTGLEPVVDNLNATNRVFTFNGGAETISISNNLGTLDIDSDLFGEVVQNIPMPTGSLVINALADDAIVVHTAITHGAVTLNAGTVTLNANIGGTVSGTASTVNVNAGGVIQSGIDVAAASAIVTVQAGTTPTPDLYPENVVINKQLTLQGSNAANPELVKIRPTTGIGIDITVDGVVVKDLQVEGPGGTAAGISIASGADNVTINNVVSSLNQTRLLIDNSTSTVSDLTLTNVKFNANGTGLAIGTAVKSMV